MPCVSTVRPRHARVPPESVTIDSPIWVGKYLVSPLSRRLGPGRWASSVSIRTGRGTATHDRILRFVPEFDSSDNALRYATAQGLAWIAAPETTGACAHVGLPSIAQE